MAFHCGAFSVESGKIKRFFRGRLFANADFLGNANCAGFRIFSEFSENSRFSEEKQRKNREFISPTSCMNAVKSV
ncbi:MAG: hypothetical protein E7029_02535 [Planctomycetaceae bacterium]|nr:hypothetical protein [Planctomycetaceae bacterium]